MRQTRRPRRLSDYEFRYGIPLGFVWIPVLGLIGLGALAIYLF